MSRKDFELIAQVFAYWRGIAGGNRAARELHSAMARTMAMRLLQTNPRFDRARFLTACAVPAKEQQL